jgi:hypothetical protein
MNTIPTRYSKHGWRFKLVERTAKAAIYSQSRHPDLPEGGKASAYELVRIRKRKERTFERAGVSVKVEAGEYLPSTEEWGSQGWTFPTLGQARDRLKRDFGDPSLKQTLGNP